LFLEKILEEDDFVLDLFSSFETIALEKNPLETNISPQMTLIKAFIEVDEVIAEPLLIDLTFEQVYFNFIFIPTLSTSFLSSFFFFFRF